MASSTPGFFCAMSLMRRITFVGAVERGAVAAAARSRSGTACPGAGTKPPGTALNRPKVDADQREVDAPSPRALREITPLDRRRYRPSSRAGTRVLKPRKNQPKRRVHARGSAQSFGCVVAAQQHGGERRRQGQRVDRRDHGRDRDGQRELAVELAGQAADEGRAARTPRPAPARSR